MIYFIDPLDWFRGDSRFPLGIYQLEDGGTIWLMLFLAWIPEGE